MEKITSFRGEYRFLSNLHPAPFTFGGLPAHRDCNQKSNRQGSTISQRNVRKMI